MIDSKISRIQDIAGGKADTEFATALREVVQNMNDANCDPRTVRRITMTVSFKQDPRNGLVDVELDTAVKLAKKASKRSLAYIGKGSDGQMGLFLDDPDQVAMFDNLSNGPKNTEEVAEDAAGNTR